MKKIFTLLFLLISVSAFAQKHKATAINNERFIESQYYNMVTLRSGYSMFNTDLGRFGYNVSLEYDRYLSRNLYILGSYIHAYSKNTDQFKSTDYEVTGSMQDHIIAVGVGYDMLKANGHRIYGAVGVGAGYQGYKRDVVVNEFPFTEDEITEEGWSVSYFPTVGYGYTFVPSLEIGLSWAGYFVREYWANSFNVHVGYRF